MNPLYLNEPIEGALVSEDEVMRAPVLQVQILEGNQSMIGNKLEINAQGLLTS